MPKPSKKRKDPSDLATRRAELFTRGSTFKHTERHHIVGIDGVLDEIDDVIHWLTHAAEYQHHQSRLEPGIIFEGKPGTGKTLVSRYIASASEALFINIADFPKTGSTFDDNDVGALFNLARKVYTETSRPIVLFWDEFEQNGVHRGDASPDQAAQVARLISELEGIHGKNQGILLIGCTNYMTSLDPALKRPGRMGLHIAFNPPDREGKAKLLEFYIGQHKRNVQGKINFDDLSYFFHAGACAADIEEAVVEAWRYATRRHIKARDASAVAPILRNEDLVEVFVKRLVGPPAMFINLPPEDRFRVAIHEVGHAIACLAYDVPLRLITVKPGRDSLGHVSYDRVREHIASTDEYISSIRVSLGSIAAEREAQIPAGVGATADLVSASDYAMTLVDDLYSGKRLGLLSFSAAGANRNAYGHAIGQAVDGVALKDGTDDIRELLDDCMWDVALAMVNLGRDNLTEIARVVNREVTMMGDDFADVVRGITGLTNLTDLAKESSAWNPSLTY